MEISFTSRRLSRFQQWTVRVKELYISCTLRLTRFVFCHYRFIYCLISSVDNSTWFCWFFMMLWLRSETPTYVYLLMMLTLILFHIFWYLKMTFRLDQFFLWANNVFLILYLLDGCFREYLLIVRLCHAWIVVEFFEVSI